MLKRSVYPLPSGSHQVNISCNRVSATIILPAAEQNTVPWAEFAVPSGVLVQDEIDDITIVSSAARTDMDYYARTGLIWNKEG